MGMKIPTLSDYQIFIGKCEPDMIMVIKKDLFYSSKKSSVKYKHTRIPNSGVSPLIGLEERVMWHHSK